MIRTETRGDRVYTYSDAGMMIRQDQTGILYRDAIDVPEMGYTYTETDQPVEVEAPDLENIEQAAQYLLGQRLVIMPQQVQPDYFSENEPEPNYFNEED